MSKEQLIPVRDAATKAGVSEETIRKYIREGELRASKKNFLLWDEWFVTKGELDRLLKQKAEQANKVKETGKLGVIGSKQMQQGKTLEQASEMVVEKIAEKLSESEGTKEVEAKVEVGSDTGATTPSVSTESHTLSGPPDEFPTLEVEAFSPAANVDEAECLYPSEFADSVRRSMLTVAPPEFSESTGQSQSNADEPWPQDYRERAKTVAEEFLAPLLSRLEAQAALLREKDKLIAEQAAQLRLLPDFQRRVAENEELLVAAEEEVEHLRNTLDYEKRNALIKICAWQTKHVQVEEKVRDIEGELSKAKLEKEFEVRKVKAEQEEELIRLRQVKKHQDSELQIMQAKREFQELEFQQIQMQLFKIHDELNAVRNRTWWQRLLKKY